VEVRRTGKTVRAIPCLRAAGGDWRKGVVLVVVIVVVVVVVVSFSLYIDYMVDCRPRGW
jgi:hypothetical protein